MTKPSASAVSRALADGGMTKSESRTTRIRGWHDTSAGFRVSTWREDDYVGVEWIRDRYRREDVSRVEMAKAAAILTAKGYVVESIGGRPDGVTLKVRKTLPAQEPKP